MDAPQPVTMGVAQAGGFAEGGHPRSAAAPSGKKIAVLGATGRTGVQFVQLALERGYAVRGVCRNSTRPLVQDLLAVDQSNSLEFVEGDVWSKDSLRQSIRGCHMVFCFLEFSHEFGGCFDPPKRLGCCCTPSQRCNPRYCEWARDLCEALQAEGIRRLVLQSTWFSQTNWYDPVKLCSTLNCGMICMLRTTCGAGMWNGFQSMEDEIQKSDLDYTIVRCPILDRWRPKTETSSGFKLSVGADQMFVPPFCLPPGCAYCLAQRTYPDAARFFAENIDNFQRQSVVFR